MGYPGQGLGTDVGLGWSCPFLAIISNLLSGWPLAILAPIWADLGRG
jgi:hypothetical protein